MKNIELASPTVMSATARAAEITSILAAIVRTVVAQAPKQREVDLGFLPDQRVHTTPLSTGEAYLESRVAYKLQEEAFGGLSPETQRRLSNIGIRPSKIKQRRQSRDIHLAPGTVPVREWGERDHKVTVTADGAFEYEARLFKSLSSVARHIAGTLWSGPLFFGLRRNSEVCE